MANPFNLTEADVDHLEKRLAALFENLKANAWKLTQTTEAIETNLKSVQVYELETLYAQEFGFACENYELHEQMLTLLNKIYMVDDTRLTSRRIEKEMKKYLLVSLTDR